MSTLSSRPELMIAIKAVNEAKKVFKEAERDVKQYTDTVVKENKKTQATFKDITTSMSGVVTSGFALYGAYERIRNASIGVAAAQKEVNETSITLESYQRRLNKMIKEGKTGTAEYEEVQKRIAVQEELLAVKTDRLKIAHEGVIKSYLLAATSVIPSLITGIQNGQKAFTELAASINATNISLTGFVAKAGLAVGAAAILYWGIDQIQEVGETWEERIEDQAQALVQEGKAIEWVREELIKLNWPMERTNQLLQRMTELYTEQEQANRDLGEAFDYVSYDINRFKDRYRDSLKIIQETTEETTKTVPELIKEGLLGEAQAAIQDYVNCVGSKHEQMIEGLEGDIEELTEEQEKNAEKMKIATIPNLEDMMAEWEEYGELGESAIGMTAGEIEKMEELLADNSDWLTSFVDLTEDEKAREIGSWKKSNEEIQEKINQLIEWLHDLEEAYKAVAEAREEAGVSSGGGERPRGEYEAYVVEHHSPAIATPISIKPRAPVSAPREIPSISVKSEVNINITGPVQPAVMPVLTRETKRAAYEAISEVLRDKLRRKGIPIWVGY